MKKTNGETRQKGYARPLFCLLLIAALVASIFVLSSTAVDTSVQYDVKIVSCDTHTAALSEDGKLYVWGTNDNGQFPGSDVTYSTVPVEVLAGEKIKDVAVYPSATFVLYGNDRLVVYGLDPATGKKTSSTGSNVAAGVEKVYAREYNYAYINTAGAMYAGGRNLGGQLATGDLKTYKTPVKVFDSGVSKVSLGRDFMLALMSDGTVYGWGDNTYLQLGEDQEKRILEPIMLMDEVKDISTGIVHSSFLKTDGTLWACGANSMYQSGVAESIETTDHSGKLTYTGSPLTRIMSNVAYVASGSMHSFAITETGTVYTWGYGINGELGIAEMVTAEEPTQTAHDFVQIFTGEHVSFGITADGKIYSWGDNTNYLLAKADGSDSLSPALVLDTQMNWLYTEPTEPEQEPSAPPSTDEPTPTPAPEQESSDAPSIDEPTPAPEEVPEETPVEKPEVSVVPFIDGGSDGSIRPEDDVTRAEFVKMVVAGLCDYDATKDYGATSFSDIPLGRWFENYIAYAELNELLSGYPDGTFKPNDPISRQEAAVVVAKAMKLDTAAAADYGFTDVSGWSAPYINALAAEGVLSGDGTGKFNPKNNITRAEAIKTVTAAQGFTPTDEEIALLVEGIENPYTDVAEDKWYYAYILAAQGLLNTK